jgi:molecular chaperone GrpE
MSEEIDAVVQVPVDAESLEVDEPTGDRSITAKLPPAESRQAVDPLVQIHEQLVALTTQAERYHERAAQREALIDSMHAELGKLRLGERRSLLRPLLIEVCRVRDDLLRQASTLPENFDRERAGALLESYAGSLEVALEDYGVADFTPEPGEPFQGSLHRAAGKAPTADAALVGTIASVVSPGYRELEADAVISAARVVVHVADETVRENPDLDQ